MKRIILLIVAVLFVFSFGCATKDYVKQQIDPLADRISKLEAKTVQHDGQIAAAAKEAADAKRIAIDCCEKADSAAKRAEAAAQRAEAAAEKAAKAFKLGQKK